MFAHRAVYLYFTILILCILSIRDGAVAVQVEKKQTFSMLCFGDSASTDNAYVELYKDSDCSDTNHRIAKFNPSSGSTIFIDQAFETRLSFSMETKRMTLINVAISDDGCYQCVTKGFLLPNDETKSETLEVLVRPTIEALLINNPLQAGDEETPAASCKAIGGKPAAEVVWSSDKHLAFNSTESSNPGTELSTFDTTVNLLVTPLKFFNDQPFICAVSHPSFLSGVNSTMVKLNVQFPPTVPVIEVINQNTQLECSADGNPIPEISWIMPAGNSAPNPVPGKSVIRIVSPNDPNRQNDTYVCQANNQIGPVKSSSITTAEAVTYVAVVDQSNTGVIVGAVLGTLVLLAIIAALVYWFCIRKMREKDAGIYPSKPIVRTPKDEGGWSRSSGRPEIQHANESLNQNAPPEPSRPPPDDEEESIASSHSGPEEFTEGDDVEINGSNGGLDEEEDAPTTGIISKNSVNFQHRRKRPSTSPHRRSQSKKPPQPEPSPRTMDHNDPHYEVPPREYYDEEYDDEEGHLMQDHDDMDDRFYDRPEDRYPGYQPRYDDPPMDDHLPPYTDQVQYASLDHTYNPVNPRTRPPYQEPVEYADIRSKGQIV